MRSYTNYTFIGKSKSIAKSKSKSCAFHKSSTLPLENKVRKEANNEPELILLLEEKTPLPERNQRVE